MKQKQKKKLKYTLNDIKLKRIDIQLLIIVSLFCLPSSKEWDISILILWQYDILSLVVCKGCHKILKSFDEEKKTL